VTGLAPGARIDTPIRPEPSRADNVAARFMGGAGPSRPRRRRSNGCRGGARPTIQCDHGSGSIAREFAATLAESGVGHTLIRPHTRTDNAIIERCDRTIGEKVDEHDRERFAHAQEVIAGIMGDHDRRRLHSSLSYLTPADYYHGNPEALFAARLRKLKEARHLRKQENLKSRQRLIPWPEDGTIPYPKREAVPL